MKILNGLDQYARQLGSPEKKSSESTPASGPAFSDRLKNAFDDVNSLQHTADESTEKVVMGEMGIHEGMLALMEADVSLRLLVQTKNKAMDAYREIMRMQM